MTITTNAGATHATATKEEGLAPARAKQLDALLDELAEGEKAWAVMDLPARVALLGRVHEAVAAHAQQWVDAAVSAKKLDPASPLVGEEWQSGPYALLTSLAVLQHSIRALADGHSPIAGRRLGTAPGNRVTVPVLPANSYEKLLFHGFHADVWMMPGVTAQQARDDAGLAEKHPKDTDGIGLVLGAGNITSIAPLDVLYELIAHGRVVLLKLNPTLDALHEPFEASFAPLIELGLLRIVTGAGDVGAYLAHHDRISHVHITGSAATHDVVVWGPGPEGAKRKAAGTPLLKKPITSELGGVAPVIIVPGTWSKADIAFQAEHVATMRLHNGGYNCIAGQLAIVSSDWPQKAEFIEQLKLAIAAAPSRDPWYPGSDGRVAKAAADYPTAEKLAGGRLFVDFTEGGDPSVLETGECFSPVFGVIEVPGTGQAFLDTAVKTANDDFVGTLGANVVIDPATRRKLGSGFEEAIARLQYGSIAINAWTGVVFLSAGASWGAFPGHTLENISSGIGIVHNAFLLADTERSVLTGPFRPFPRSIAGGEFALFPKPPWFVSARSSKRTGELLSGFAAKPSWLKMPGVFISAFRA
ncbi:MAG: putative gamma-aminobutyraldehyde dehydrogenase (1-pyrroline dehydrogenase) [Microbacteriaceae bacterium]|nr:putative gamma-aminobutyraldehyde dehydrogenase (1-pyrroline dehydrogenase) [Microbacteriaceae bacterium]